MRTILSIIILLSLCTTDVDAKLKYKKHKSIRSHKVTKSVKTKTVRPKNKITISKPAKSKNISVVSSIPEDATEEINVNITDSANTPLPESRSTKPIYKKVCVAGKCKTIKIHKKFNGTKVPKK